MASICFRLNGEPVTLSDVDPTQTVLDWLRDTRRLTGTKEGCNEGDCGACTVIVSEGDTGPQAVNACIMLLPQIHGKSLRTIEGVASPDGALHPIQSAMIETHGSQCGFCTPGIVCSLVAAFGQGRDAPFETLDDILAGNLCRCTGYAPIIRAADAADGAEPVEWVSEAVEDFEPGDSEACPISLDELAELYEMKPEARLIAGATDVGLWITKGLQELPEVIFLHRCTALKQISYSGDMLRVGAAVTITDLRRALKDLHPSYAEMLRRYGSQQVRNSATIGGNIANGSPIGDNAPALIALGAQLHLRKGHSTRDLPVEEFFIAYGEQDLEPGEFIEALTLPTRAPNLRCYKVSKRRDQDISAVCGCFNVSLDPTGRVESARLAYGGMAATPKRATHVERALTGHPLTLDAMRGALAEMPRDFTPLSDMRASAGYRLEIAKNLLLRYVMDLRGEPVDLMEVAP